jgi:SAM-dependent methyltransferase
MVRFWKRLTNALKSTANPAGAMPESSPLPPLQTPIGTSAASDVVLKIQNRLVHDFPSAVTALNIFKGIWVSKLPGEFSTYEGGGSAPLFEDTRIPQSIPFLGSMEGKRVLDLGPLEGGQSYVANKLGAKHVTAVETNALLFLKCLVVKEVLGMKNVSFLCGDAVEYLKKTSDEFDICLCCGILYHMVDPVDLISAIANKIERILIWTHYYDDVARERNKISHTSSMKRALGKRSFTYYKQEYREGFTTNVYCGGMETFSSWMTRKDILECLDECGFKSTEVLGDGDSISGPWMLVAAKKG